MQRALWITVPPCARESTQQEHKGTAQRRINANAKTCKCEWMPFNLGICKLNLTYVTVAVWRRSRACRS
eukprot:6201486-Pleurochrysis_carterae.AAC.2